MTTMITKERLKEGLDDSLKIAKRAAENKDKLRPSLHIKSETINFDLDAFLQEWSEENNINLAIVDIATVNKEDILTLPKILEVPTVFLLKNFGDYSHDDIRYHYRQLVKDCVLISKDVVTFTNNFLFAVATTTEDKPICDMSERGCFAYINNK